MTRTKVTAASLGFLVAGLAPAPASAQASNAFDGTWSVQSTTQRGACQPRRFNVSIEEGEISFGPFTANGGVGPRGRVSASYEALGRSLSAQGRLTPTRGGGTWTSASRGCSGRWSAQRAGG